MAEDNSNGDDAAFTMRVLSTLPPVAPTDALQERVLADFDAVAAKRRRSPRFAAMRLVRKLSDAVWPGVPLWQPVSIFALSLLIGLAAGTQMPVSAATGDASGSAQTLDVAPDLDISGDS